MKTFRLIGMALWAIVLCANFAACSDDAEVVPCDPEGDKFVTVKLGCVGEYLDITYSPLTRTTGNDLYGIQIYDAESMTPYAYGTFASLDGVTARLLDGRRYRFKVSIVIDGQNSFYGNNWGTGYVGTQFTYSSTVTLYLTDVWSSNNNFDRFYGELDNYTPVENGTVNIDTKRVAYGVKYVAEDLLEGSINIVVSCGGYSEWYSVQLTTTSPVYESIYTFENISAAWWGMEVITGYDPMTGEQTFEYQNYASTKTLNVSWTKADGEVFPLGTYQVTFKRNVKTTIRIKAEERTSNNGIIVTKEEAAMVDDDHEYLIEGGTVVEVPITAP